MGMELDIHNIRVSMESMAKYLTAASNEMREGADGDMSKFLNAEDVRRVAKSLAKGSSVLHRVEMSLINEVFHSVEGDCS